MLLKRINLVVIIVSVLASVLLILTDNYITNQINEKPKVKMIRVGMEYWPGFFLIPLADKLNYFSDENVNVEISYYDDFVKLEDDFNNNRLDARGGYPSDVISSLYDNNNYDYEKIIFMTDYSYGGDALISRKDYVYNSNKKINLGIIDDVDFVTLFFLYKIDLSIENVKYFKYNSASEAVNAFNEGKIDYLIIYEPFLSDLINNKGAKVVYSSANDPGVISDAISFTNSFLINDEKYIESFARAYFRAYDYWLSHNEESINLVKQIYGLNSDEFKDQLKKIKILSLSENNDALSISTGFKSLYGNLRIVNSFIKNLYPESETLNTDIVIYPNVIKKLNQI